jgi:hypothetical protein
VKGGKWIDYWAAAAPKDYGGILNDGTFVGRLKGFKNNAEVEENISHENRVKLIKGQLDYIMCKQMYFEIHDYKDKNS